MPKTQLSWRLDSYCRLLESLWNWGRGGVRKLSNVRAGLKVCTEAVRSLQPASCPSSTPGEGGGGCTLGTLSLGTSCISKSRGSEYTLKTATLSEASSPSHPRIPFTLAIGTQTYTLHARDGWISFWVHWPVSRRNLQTLTLGGPLLRQPRHHSIAEAHPSASFVCPYCASK